MSTDPLLVAALTLAVALVALLFGPGIGIRGFNAVRGDLRKRAAREKELLEFLEHSAVFLDGLPLFISETWAWGPSVPNYAAGGSFPSITQVVSERMPSIAKVVERMCRLYTDHSGKQGLQFATIEEAKIQVAEIEELFWRNVEGFAKTEWPFRWRSRVRKLRALKLPSAERDRILNLKTQRRPQRVSHA
jgi:hypothetical protein